jgi:hypothetical protein
MRVTFSGKMENKVIVVNRGDIYFADPFEDLFYQLGDIVKYPGSPSDSVKMAQLRGSNG